MARKTEKVSEKPTISIGEVEEKLKRTEKKLNKAEERVKVLKEANLSLTQGMTELEKQLRDTEQSEDFIKLKELYDQVEEIRSWSRAVALPFGEFSFSIRGGYIDVELRKMKADKNEFTLGAAEQAQLQLLCEAINEAREKRIELEKLQERIRPLANVIRRTSEMIDENARRSLSKFSV